MRGVVPLRRTLALLLALLFALSCSAALAEEYAIGARGDDVTEIQARLIELNYLTGSADGVYGKQTASAVQVFQEAHALPSTGSVDGATRALLFSGDATALPPALKKDDEGEEVLALQKRLILLGFLDGEADGKYGKQTQKAVAAFQQHLIAQGVSSVAASGEATPVTRELLANPEHSTYLMDLLPGDTAGEAERIERRLRDLGYLDAQPDDSYDEYTARAVQAFQLDSGIPGTGVVDRQAVDLLFSEGAAVAERFVAHDIQEGDRGRAVEAVQAKLAQYGALAAYPDGKFSAGTSAALERFYDYLVEVGNPHAEQFSTAGMLSANAQDLLEDEDFFAYRGDVQKNSPEGEVLRLQRRLHTLFYLGAGSVTGKYGDVTTAAVKQFQGNNRLAQTGVADEATLRELFSDRAVGNWTKYLLKISLDDQRVYVYGLNSFGEYELDREMICSTGLGNSTPRGIFLSSRPLNRWHYFEKFECWAQYSYQIQGDILFHSVLYSDRSERTLRSSSVYALGRKASHGCVRLKVEDAKWLFENCDRGTVVVIY